MTVPSRAAGVLVRVEPEPAERRAEMVRDGAPAEAERVRDPLLAVPLGHERRDLRFTRGEAVGERLRDRVGDRDEPLPHAHRLLGIVPGPSRRVDAAHGVAEPRARPPGRGAALRVQQRAIAPQQRAVLGQLIAELERAGLEPKRGREVNARHRPAARAEQRVPAARGHEPERDPVPLPVVRGEVEHVVYVHRVEPPAHRSDRCWCATNALRTLSSAMWIA